MTTDPMNTDLRWAVMGTGTIAGKVLPRIQAGEGCRVTCVASRSLERARAFACEQGLPEAAACTYDELARRDDVDAVYVTIPNHLHGLWCIRLLEGGKHVLCEKPLTAFRREAEAIFDAARRADRLAVEGFMYMHHPQTARLIEIARAGDGPGSVIGPLVGMEGWFRVNLVPLAHSWTRFLHSMWGGALLDLGCYPIGLSRLVTGREPRVVEARATWAKVPEGETRPVDLAAEVALEYEIDGRRVPCVCACSMGEEAARKVLFRMEGEWGAVETGQPFGADPERAVLTVERNERHPDGAGRDEIVLERGGERFENQFADFARAVRGEMELLPSPAWSIGQAGLMEEILGRMGLRFDRP